MLSDYIRNWYLMLHFNKTCKGRLKTIPAMNIWIYAKTALDYLQSGFEHYSRGIN